MVLIPLKLSGETIAKPLRALITSENGCFRRYYFYYYYRCHELIISKYKTYFFSVCNLNWEVVFLPATYTYLSKLKSGVIFAKLSQPGTLLCIFLIEARKNLGPTKYSQEHKFRTTKYLQENFLDPRSTQEKKFRT